MKRNEWPVTRCSRRSLEAYTVAFGVLLALSVAEFSLRLFFPQRSAETIGMAREDPYVGYQLRESYANEIRTPEFRIAVVTDAEGYRVPKPGDRPRRAGAPSSQALRVLVIGDSFTFGMGVNAEDAFPEVLEQRFNEDHDVEVRNGGVGGYGPLRSARLLLNLQAAWNPEILVHAFYVGNDLEDPKPATFRTEPRVVKGRKITPGRHTLMNLRFALRKHSHLYSFLRARLYGFYDRSGLSLKGQYLETVSLAEWPAEVTKGAWPAGRRALREIRDWAQEQGVRYLVVLVPSKHQVDDEAWKRYQRAWGLPASEFERDRGQRIVLEYLASLGVPTIDLLPEFRTRASVGKQLYFKVDRHWTSTGHRLAARIIDRDLRRRGWLD